MGSEETCVFPAALVYIYSYKSLWREVLLVVSDNVCAVSPRFHGVIPVEAENQQV